MAARRDPGSRVGSGEAPQQLVDGCRHAVQPPEQDDLAVQLVGLDNPARAREALP